jgi:2,3-dihydroxy-p-cumate/2,3-dihydroxybenzoate 3,4-dioxygenase
MVRPFIDAGVGPNAGTAEVSGERDCMTVADIRYARLGYVAINVTDLNRSADFYETIVGLSIEERTAEAVFLRCSDKHHDIMLLPASEPGLKRVGWQMESEQALSALEAHMARIGSAIVEVSPDETASLSIGRALRVTEASTGTTFEFYVDMTPASSDWQPTHTKIARLGHLVIGSPDPQAMRRFMIDELNFRVSDQIDEMVTFMRCFPNPYHHSFGVGASSKPVLNHVNFMVSEIDDIGKGHNRVRAAGSEVVFGPGRHPPSDSIFLYFLDPDGITLEYSFGMEEFDEIGARDPRMLPKGGESVDYWGGSPSSGFGKIGAIERMDAAGA